MHRRVQRTPRWAVRARGDPGSGPGRLRRRRRDGASRLVVRAGGARVRRGGGVRDAGTADPVRRGPHLRRAAPAGELPHDVGGPVAAWLLLCVPGAGGAVRAEGNEGRGIMSLPVESTTGPAGEAFNPSDLIAHHVLDSRTLEVPFVGEGRLPALRILGRERPITMYG